MATCVLVTSLSLLIMAFVACGVAFFAPFWLRSLTGDDHTEGLWGYCGKRSESDCIWFYEDDFAWEKQNPEWFRAAQGLYAFGYATQIAILLIAILHVCCLCCKESFSMAKVIGGLLFFAFGLIMVAIAVFGGMAYKDDKYKASLHSITYKFDWAFYVAIVGVCLDFLAACLFMCDGCRGSTTHEGYQRGDVI